MGKFRTEAFSSLRNAVGYLTILMALIILPSDALRQGSVPSRKQQATRRRHLMEDRLPTTFVPVAPMTMAPIVPPTAAPTSPSPSASPTNFPTTSPTFYPTGIPSSSPSVAPSKTTAPSDVPSAVPTASLVPSGSPSINLENTNDRALSNIFLSVVVPKQEPENADMLRKRKRVVQVNGTEWEELTYRHVSEQLQAALVQREETPYVSFELKFDGFSTMENDDVSVTFTQLVTSVAYFHKDSQPPLQEQLDDHVQASFRDTALFEYLLLLEQANDPVLASTQKVILENAQEGEDASSNDGGIDIGQILLYAGIGAGALGLLAIAYFVFGSKWAKRQDSQLDLKQKETADSGNSLIEGSVSSKQEGQHGSPRDEQAIPPPPESVRSYNDFDDGSSVGASSTYSYFEKTSQVSVADLYALTEQHNQAYDDMTQCDDSVLGSLNGSPSRYGEGGDDDSVQNASLFSELWTDGDDNDNALAPPSTQKKSNVSRSSIAADTRDWEAKYGIPPSDNRSEAFTEIWDDGMDEARFEAGVPSSIFAPASVQIQDGADARGWEEKYGIPKAETATTPRDDGVTAMVNASGLGPSISCLDADEGEYSDADVGARSLSLSVDTIHDEDQLKDVEDDIQDNAGDELKRLVNDLDDNEQEQTFEDHDEEQEDHHDEQILASVKEEAADNEPHEQDDAVATTTTGSTEINAIREQVNSEPSAGRQHSQAAVEEEKKQEHERVEL